MGDGAAQRPTDAAAANAASAAPSRARHRLRCCLVSFLFAGGFACAVWLGWTPVVVALGARWDRQAREHIAALEREGLAVTPEALSPRPAVDAAPLMEEVLAALVLSDAEREALLREDSWRGDPKAWMDPRAPEPDVDAQAEPGAPMWDAPTAYRPAEHDAIVSRLLTRLDAITPTLDRALESDGWLLPVTSLDAPPNYSAVIDLKDLLYVRGAVRGRDSHWRDMARVGRLIAIMRDPTLIGALSSASWGGSVAHRIETALALAPVDAAAARSLTASLAALERPDALSVGLRADLLRTLDHFAPDGEGFTLFEKEIRLGDALRLDGAASPGVRSVRPLRFLAYLEDRPRWARLQSVAARAALLPRLEAKRRLEELKAEASALGEQAPISARLLPSPSSVDRIAEGWADTRMARMALELALAADGGDLAETAPLQLPDPFTDPPAALRWRRDAPRSGTLWSVGSDQVDDGGSEELDADTGKRRDLVLRVALPAR
jgi:hypothetical protein